jgi:hypothetical protein
MTPPGAGPSRSHGPTVRQTLIGDKNYSGRWFETQLAGLGIRLLRPARKGEAERAGSQLFKSLRQVIESVNENFKRQVNACSLSVPGTCSSQTFSCQGLLVYLMPGQARLMSVVGKISDLSDGRHSQYSEPRSHYLRES